VTSQQARHWDDEVRDPLVGLSDELIVYLSAEYFLSGMRAAISFAHFARTAILLRRTWDGASEKN
jgi:hypothetical protein